MTNKEIANKILWMGYASAECGKDSRRKAVEEATDLLNKHRPEQLILPVVRKCTCEIPDPRMKNSENGVSGYCVKCVKPL